MAMTDTRPAAGAPAEAPPPAPAPVEPPGLAGWLFTSDHKRIGRLWLATSLVFLLAGGVLGGLLGVERLDSGVGVLRDSSFGHVYSAHAEIAVLLFLVPFFLGLATYLVPLQIGSPEIAFPRGSATAYWGYLVSGMLLCGSYLADGGFTGSEDSAVDLYVLSLVVLAISLALGALSLVTTVLTMRAPGMTMLRTPLFSWSVLAGGGLVLLMLSMLVARLLELFIGQHFTGEIGDYGAIAWFWSLPAVYALVVMAVGVLLEVVPTLTHRPLRFHSAGIVIIGLFTVVGTGGWLYDPNAYDDLLYVAIGLAAVVPALALVGILGDTRRASAPALRAPLVLALGSALLIFLGTVAGGLQVIEPLELAGTTWESGQMHLVLLGGATLAAFAALWFWAPKLWGAHLSETAGYLVALLLFGGTVLVAVPDLVNGAAEGLPLGATEWSADTVDAANPISLAGAGVSALGAVVALGAVIAGARQRLAFPAVANPWNGFTLEWATTSPPPYHNFDEVPEVRSATPLVPGTDT